MISPNAPQAPPQPFGGPMAPASQGYHQAGAQAVAAKHLQNALMELRAYLQTEPDPADKHLVAQMVGPLTQVLSKDRGPAG